jgi:glycosyltransferase involved in cell wall biosynthesis
VLDDHGKNMEEGKRLALRHATGDYILFVDADIGFSAADIARVSSHSEPVVGGLYPLKNLNADVQWCGNGLQAGDAPVRGDGLSQVKYIGTGFLCIAREVFETIIAHDGPAIAYVQDFPPHRHEFAFWRQGVSHGRFLTEDWMFCQRWLELGGKIFADAQVVLRHAGRAEWPLPFQKGNPFVKA